jgi:four helix bundle protein
MKAARSHRELIVWQKGMELVDRVRRLVAGFPAEERFRISDQLLRAVGSIPKNIAEGCGRGSSRDYARFVAIARGSVSETETLLTIAHRLSFIDDAEYREAARLPRDLSRMLTSLRRHLRGLPPPPRRGSTKYPPRPAVHTN